MDCIFTFNHNHPHLAMSLSGIYGVISKSGLEPNHYVTDWWATSKVGELVSCHDAGYHGTTAISVHMAQVERQKYQVPICHRRSHIRVHMTLIDIFYPGTGQFLVSFHMA